MPEEPISDGYAPEITWKDQLIWRGKRQSGREDAYAAAKRIAERLAPTVNGDGKPALVLGINDGEFVFPLEYSAYEYRSEFMTPLQRACQAVAEMICSGTPVVAWEPVVLSGDRVIWKQWGSRDPYEIVESAQKHAETTLMDHLMPAAYKHWRDGKWEPCIDYVDDSGTVEFRRLEKDHWGTKAEAWWHAARVLADAEAGVQEIKDREPLVTLPESFVDMWDAA